MGDHQLWVAEIVQDKKLDHFYQTSSFTNNAKQDSLLPGNHQVVMDPPFNKRHICQFHIWASQIPPMEQQKTATGQSVQQLRTPAAATSTICPSLRTSGASWRSSPGSSCPWSSSCLRWLSTSWNGGARTTSKVLRCK